MTISRGQMNRQLRMGGGIMDVVPREPALFGGIKKAVKKVTKGVKKIASSDIGKAALLYAGTAGLGALGAGSAARATTGFGGIFNPTNVFKNLAASGANIAGFFKPTEFGNADLDIMKGPSRATSLLKKTFDTVKGTGNVGKLATLGAVSTFLTGTLGMTPEQAEEELARDPSGYLEQYYRNLNPPGDKDPEVYEAEVREFVSANTSEYAEGGRIGFDNGSPRGFDVRNFKEQMIQDMIKESPDGIVMDGERDTSILDSLRDGGAGTLDPSFPPVEYDDGTVYFPKTDEYYKKDGTQVDGISPGAKPVPKTLEAASGGRIGFNGGGDAGFAGNQMEHGDSTGSFGPGPTFQQPMINTMPQPQLNPMMFNMPMMQRPMPQGIIGLKDGGPPNPGRRNFMKLMAGLASLPVVGKLFKGAKVADKVVQLKNTTTTMPAWFPKFVDRFISKGVGKKVDQDLMQYETKDLPGVKLEVKTDGKIRVEGQNAYNEPYVIDYEPPGYEVVDYSTGKAVKTKGEFAAADTQYFRTGDPREMDYDVDYNTVEDLDDLLGGNSTKLEGFARGTNKEKYTKGQRAVDEADSRADVYEGPDIDMSDYEDFAKGGLAYMLGE